MVLTAVFAVIAAFFGGQDLFPDIARWFPEGRYREISHVDYEKLPADVLDEMQDPKRVRNAKTGSILFLPTPLRYGLLSITRARTAKFQVFKRAADGGPGKSADGQPLYSIATFFHGGESYSVADSGAYLMVARYLDLEQAIKRAAVRGAIESTDVIWHKRPVYTWRFEHETLGTYDFYGWGASTGEFVFCSDRELLGRMVETGMTGCYPALDEEDLRQLREQFPDLGQAWTWDNLGAAFDAANRWLKEHASSPEEAGKEQLPEEGMRRGYIYSTNYEKGGDILTSTYVYFAREEDAEEYFEQTKANIARAKAMPASKELTYASFQALGESKSEVSLHGLYVVVAKLIDQELIEAQRLLSEQFRKEAEEKKEKQ